MKGMISPINARSQGPRFYRLMAFLAIGFNLVFPLVQFTFRHFETRELIWDRAIVISLAVLIIYMSYVSLEKRKRIYYLSNLLFYAFVTQSILTGFINDFHPGYTIALALCIQPISIAFQRIKQALLFLSYTFVVLLIGLYINDGVDSIVRLYTAASFGCMTVLLMCFAILKTRFDREKRMREELLRTIVSKTEDGIFLTDFEGFIQEANNRAIELFGFDFAELVGKNFSDLRKNPLTEEEDDHGVRQLLRNRFWNSEVELRTKSGECFYAFLSITWIHRFEEEYLVYKVIDISERKEFEAEIIRAKEMAEEATMAKSEFLATMSHEIRTPMNGVLGMTNILMSGDLTADQRSYLDTIKKSGESLLVIINDILDFSKIESGKMKLESQEFGLRDVLNDVHQLLRLNAERKHLALNLDLSTDLPDKIIGDSTRLRQILVNLVGNAIKFTHKGQVTLSAKQNSNGQWIQFSIKDSGIGIPREQITQLFESFTQLDSSTTRKFGGTGLGLSICKKLVELMEGRIWVDSEPGVGSEFHFVIPNESVSLNKTNDGLPEMEYSISSSFISIDSLRVLLAEDNLINQQVGKLILENMGVAVDLVANGKEAIEALRENHYDLILMDLHMPEMDGLEATRWIRERVQYDSLKIIALTANAFEEDRKACLRAGMDDFLTKPIKPEELKSILSKITTNTYEDRA